ncbi:MAG: tetratricopeptide repeat protein [Gallionella sp.]|nr:tetratricopeptide repeat protein [Gallionella sp.]MDD4945896.1 tetratricopeptide repeat protein [Gallionella sp.]MDD5611829.1 tetratricopeptide repeat protein [Gallionella sp.]
MNAFKYLLAGSLLLAGCAQLPKPAQPEPAEPVAQAAPEPKVEPAPVLPSIELSRELLYEMLLTEFASQRGHTTLAMEGSTDLAQKTRDPRLAKRAAQLTLQSGDMNRSIEAFRFWQEVDPQAVVAPRLLASMLLRGGKLDEARVELLKVIEDDPTQADKLFMQLYPVLSAYPEPVAALKLARELAQACANVAESHWLVAQLAQKNGDEALALNEVRQARQIAPDWDMAVMLEALLLRKPEPQQGLELLKQYLGSHPQAREVRMQYARSLLEQAQYKPAREEFRTLLKENPDNVQLAFAVALISIQMKEPQGAEGQLKQALTLAGKDQDAIEYFLGQLAEAADKPGQALPHYREVKGGEYRFTAQMRAVSLLEKLGDSKQAREYLQTIKPENNQQRAQLVLTEAQQLGREQKFAQAYEVLQRGLEVLPHQTELLYEAAMMADKLGKYEASEQLLRKLIKVKPDHAHAYNALGYSLLERNVRTSEALALVEKALQLAPGDAAIMDSVGWGYYRAGRLDDSVAMLRRALGENPDPEIAAHLGEVLWAKGDREAATKLWRDSFKAHPDSLPLQAVMKRFLP